MASFLFLVFTYLATLTVFIAFIAFLTGKQTLLSCIKHDSDGKVSNVKRLATILLLVISVLLSFYITNIILNPHKGQENLPKQTLDSIPTTDNPPDSINTPTTIFPDTSSTTDTVDAGMSVEVENIIPTFLIDDPIVVSDSRIPDGKGRFAFRGVCDNCAESYSITFYPRFYNFEANSYNISAGNYNYLQKESTTKNIDLNPGDYDVVIGVWDNPKQEVTFSIKIIKGKTSLYYFDRKNPFGNGNGRLVFIPKFTNEKWLIILDSTSIGVASTNKSRIRDSSLLFKDIPQGYFSYVAAPLTNSDLLDTIRSRGYINEGQKIRIYLGD